MGGFKKAITELKGHYAKIFVPPKVKWKKLDTVANSAALLKVTNF